MGAITSAATGNWNSTGTWSGGTIPVSGDTVTIANGHTVTVPNGYTAACGLTGTISATDYALRTSGDSGTGILVVAAGGVIEVSSHIRQGNVNWEIYGSVLAAHTSTRLSWQIGTSSTGPYGRLIVEGTGKGARAIVGKTAGGVGWNALGGPTAYAGRAQMTTNWAMFEHVGSSSLQFNEVAYVTGWHNVHENTWWDNCGEIDYRNLLAATEITIDGCAFTNPVNSSGGSIVFTTNANVSSSAIVRRFVNSAFVGDVRMFTLTAGQDMGFEVDNVALASVAGTPIDMGTKTDNAGNGLQKSISRLLTYQESTSGARNGLSSTSDGVVSKVIGVRQCATDSGSEDTFHFYPSADLTVEDGWVEVHPGWNTGTGAGSATNGGDDAFAFNNTSVTCDITMRRCISATNDMGKTSGSILSVGGNTSWQTGKRFFVDRCTMPNGSGFSAEHGTPTLGTGSTPFATVTNSILSNPSSTASQFFASTATFSGLPDGILAASGNAIHNVSGTPYAGGANTIASTKYSPSGFPTNALNEDPDFLDPTRTFLAYGRFHLANPSLNDRRPIFDEFVKRYTDDTWDSVFNIDDCLAWLQEGYRPQNANYNVGGSWVGAVDGPISGVTAGLVNASRAGRRSGRVNSGRVRSYSRR